MSRPGRSEALRVHDILKSIGQIHHIVSNHSFDNFKGNFILVNSVIRDLEVIGEACGHLPPSVTDEYPDIPWRDIRDMRNILAHEYFAVNIEIIWKAATEEIPILEKTLRQIEKTLSL